MADTKVSALTAITGANVATGDLALAVDVSDTSMAASGTDKKITFDELCIAVATTLGVVGRDKLWDAKGDLAVATGADTAAKLTASATQGLALLTESSSASGLAYGLPTPNSLYMSPAGTAIAETVPRQGVNAGTITTTSGTLRLQAIVLPKNRLITSISMRSIGAANGPTHWWFALLDSSRVYLRSTADQTSTAWGAATTKTVNLSSTFTTTYEGLHYIGFLETATVTVNTLIGMTNLVDLVGVAPILGGTSDAGLTTPQSDGVTAGAMTATANQMYAWVS